MKLNRLILNGLLILTCTSCASLFNRPIRPMTLITDAPARVVVNKDTLSTTHNEIKFMVRRQKASLPITVFNDAVAKNLSIVSHNSFAYWANLGFLYGLGMLDDKDNPKRYGYPVRVYVSMKSNEAVYQTIDSAAVRNRFIVKLSPLKLIDISNPGVEFTIERRTSKSFSTQVLASFLFRTNPSNNQNYMSQDISGFRTAIEEKYYFKKSAPIGYYLALELNYLKKRENSAYFDDGVDYPGPGSGRIDSINLHKQTFTINLKLGYQYFFKRFTLESYFGIGIRYKDVQYLHGYNPYRIIGLFPIDGGTGKGWHPVFPLNVRIGWTF